MQNGIPAKSFLWKDAILLILCFVVFGAGESATQSTMDPSEDHDFAAEAASGGISEVKLGHLALQKGNSNAVKSFGLRAVSFFSGPFVRFPICYRSLFSRCNNESNFASHFE